MASIGSWYQVLWIRHPFIHGLRNRNMFIFFTWYKHAGLDFYLLDPNLPLCVLCGIFIASIPLVIHVLDHRYFMAPAW